MQISRGRNVGKRDDNWLGTWSMNRIGQAKQLESRCLIWIRIAWAKQSEEIQDNWVVHCQWILESMEWLWISWKICLEPGY